MLIGTADRSPQVPEFTVYPDHFEIADGHTGRRELDVYCTPNEMLRLADALMAKANETESGPVHRFTEGAFWDAYTAIKRFVPDESGMDDDLIVQMVKAVLREVGMNTAIPTDLAESSEAQQPPARAQQVADSARDAWFDDAMAATEGRDPAGLRRKADGRVTERRGEVL